MGKTQHGSKRTKRRSTYKKSGSIKPLTMLKTIAGVGKKNVKTGRTLIRKKFLAGKLGIKIPKLIGGKRRTKKRAGKRRQSKSRKQH